MIKNFLITALRNLKRNKVYGTLNVLGLALGIGCALVIFKVITYELSHDKYHTNFDKIYRVVRSEIYPDGMEYGAGVPHPLGTAIREEISDISTIVRIHYSYGDQVNTIDEYDNLVKHDIESGLVFAEPQIFDVFDIEVLHGDAKSTLSEPNKAVISIDIAKRLFGDIPISEIIGKKFNLSNKIDVTVGAIVANHPKNTMLPYQIIFSYASQDGYNQYYGKGTYWNSISGGTNAFVLLDSPDKVSSITRQLENILVKYRGNKAAEEEDYFLQPMSEVHFDGRFGTFEGNTISRSMLIALGVIGMFLIITACINFINLATAQAVKRSKEIGIRKAIGVSKKLLILQFMSETFLITLLAVIMALAIGEVLLHNMEEVLGYSLSLNLLGEPTVLLFIVFITIFVALLSGFYPSFLLSKMNTIKALKNSLSGKQSGGGISLRRALVVIQFSISQTLIIGTLVVGAQMKYFYSKDLGFTRDAIITTYLPENSNPKVERFRNRLLESSLIKDVTFSLAPPRGNNNSHSNFNHPRTQSESDFNANFKTVDHRYIDFFGLKLIAGRKLIAGDSSNYAIINRKVFDLLGL
ncbi:MAG: ABC transporter permease, partial [Cyclobacteriaceae bacterium]